MPILKDRVTQLEYNIQKMQEELSNLREKEKIVNSNKIKFFMDEYKFTPTYMRRRSAI
jgi:hypothetical protein